MLGLVVENLTVNLNITSALAEFIFWFSGSLRVSAE